MINYDYILKKNDGYETKEFVPLFDKQISNVSVFRGHNSSGKSTLMDLIALSMYGESSPEVISKLKEKIEYLKTADNSEFDFSLKASNQNVALKVHAKKTGFIDGNGEWESSIQESRGGSQYIELTKESFKKKYRVIYDMPDRPMERVQELVRGAERIIHSTIDSIDGFRYSLISESKLAENSRNEDLIFLLRNEISTINDNILNYSDDVDQIKKMSKKINSLYYSSELIRLNNEKQEIESKIGNLTSEKTKKEKAAKKESKDYESKVRNIKYELKVVVENYRIACNQLDRLDKIEPSEISAYKQFSNMTADSIFNQNCSHLYNYRQISKEIISTVHDKYDDQEIAMLSEKKKLLGELVTALEPYLSDEIEVLDSPINSVYAKLTDELSEIKEKVGKYDLAQDTIDRIETSSNAAKVADSIFEDLGERPTIEPEISSGIATNLNARREVILKKIAEVNGKSVKYGVTMENCRSIYNDCQDDVLLNDYRSLSIDDLCDKANELENNISNKQQKINDFNTRLINLQNQLDDAESKEPHPLSEYKNELAILNDKIQEMMISLQDKDSMLIQLSREEKVTEIESNQNFLEQVWVYLGKRLGSVQHIGQTYSIKKIDMNSREIITEIGSKIPFKDMGTGESQLAYLSGLLNSDDDRITIALFDEIDHMDPIIISKIQNKLKELFDSGKLLIGIMAAPAVGTEVVSCE